MTLARTVNHVMKRAGTFYTLRKVAGGTQPNSWTAATAPSVTYHALIAKERSYKPSEIRGGILENDSLIVVDASSGDAVPAVGERIALGVHTGDENAAWSQIVNVYPARVNGNVATYRLQVRR